MSDATAESHAPDLLWDFACARGCFVFLGAICPIVEKLNFTQIAGDIAWNNSVCGFPIQARQKAKLCLDAWIASEVFSRDMSKLWKVPAMEQEELHHTPDFNWSDNRAVVVQPVEAIAVYSNEDHDVVIRQQDRSGGGEEMFVIVPRSRVQDVIEAMKRELEG